MANGYDGDIELSVGLSLEDVIAQSKRLNSAVSKILQNIDTSNLDKGTKKLVDNMTKAQSETKKLETEVEGLSKKLEAVEDYKLDVKVADDAIREYSDKLLDLYETRKKLSEQKVSTNDERWKAVNADIKELTRTLNYYIERKKQLSENPIVANDEEEKLKSVVNKLDEVNGKLRTNIAAFENLHSSGSSASSLLGSFGSLSPTFAKLGSSIQGVAGAFSKVAAVFTVIKTVVTTVIEAIKKIIDVVKKVIEIFKKLATVVKNTFATIAQTTESITNIFLRLGGFGPVIDGIRNKIGGLFSRFKSASAAAGGFGQTLQQGLKKLLAYGLGIASLTALFSKLRSAITSGIQSMAKMNGGANQTNAMMTQLTSSLNLLKGALATAFVPILTVVSPILSGFMQQLANIITFIGMMIAKLTGAKSYMKATFKSSDYAAGLGGGGGGKSAQQKYEEAVKKAQEKYDEQVAKTKAKNADRMAKAEEKQAKAAKKLAKEQEKANGKLAAFDDLNVLGVDTIEDLEEAEADLLEMPELELPSLEDFTGSGGGGGKDPFGLENVPLDDFEWNWDDLRKKARELGKKLAEFLNDIFADKELARKIGNTIGNLINLAIEFAYGFIDTFKFLDFGEWIGTLIQEAIETIDWALLGKTIGKGLNGIADTIIGFFKGYDVGTLGSSMATMLNNAIHTIDASKLGEAFADVLKAPLIEMTTFLTEADWKAVASKLSEFIRKVFESDELNGETLGQSVGKLVQSIVNALNDFFSGWETGTLGRSIAKYISDAVGELKPEDFAEVTYNTVNMVAGEIRAFFEGLPIEELATKIATWINESVKGVDTNEVAASIKSILKTAFLFIADLFKNTDFEEIGKQIGDIIVKTFGVEEEAGKQKGSDLADAASSMIANIINAALGFLDGLESTGAIDALKDWIWNVIKQSIEKIDTEWITHKIFQKLTDALAALTVRSNPILNFIFDKESLEEIQKVTNAIDDLNFKVTHGKITVDEYKQKYYELTGIMPEVTSSFNNFDGQIQGIANSFKDSTEKTNEFVQTNQEKAPEVKSAWEGVTEPVDEFNGKLGETRNILESELPASVETGTTSVRDMITGATSSAANSINSIGTATEGVEVKGATHIHNLADNFDGLSLTATTTSDVVCGTLNNVNGAVDTSNTNVNAYSDSAVEALARIDAKTGEVSINFEQMTELVQLQLESLTTMIDTWYQEMVLQYFSYDTWLLMLQEGPLLALTDFFTLLATEFDTQMQTLWNTHLLPWFADTRWQTAIYTPWFTFLKTKWKNLLKWWDDEAMKPWWEKHLLVWFKDDKWQTDVYTPWFNYLSTTKWTNLMTWWDTSMKDWWDNKVVPWFEQEKWEKEFDHVYDAAKTIGEKTRDKIKELAEETEDAVHEACINMKGWIEDVIDQLREAIALAQQLQAISRSGGGGGSSSSSSGSSGGGSNSGGGSDGRSFMPMLNIMHFEDNLGMSAFKFPELATGAVIPPNNEFLAILGDQRNGMNIETPLSTMLEAFRSVMDEYMGGSHQSAIMEVDGETFARLMMPHMVDEMHRLGYNTEIIEGI